MLHTLGGLALDGSDRVQQRPLLLLAYLAVEGRKERGAVAELFWPDAADPRNRLSGALSHLRRAGVGSIEADAVRVATTVDLDATEMERAVLEGRFDDAARLYRGPFLAGLPPEPGVALEEWIFATREHFAGLARRALLGEAEAHAARGRFEAAAEKADAAARLRGAPELDEEQLARLALLLKAGDHPRAVAIAAEAAEFGVDVPATTAAARAALGRTGAALAPAVRHNLPALQTAFVGRTEELLRLDERLADPDCRLITIAAVGGMGKTRLALRAAERRLASFPDGVFFVPFTASGPHDAWAFPIAEALALSLDGEAAPEEQLLAHLEGRRMLLVLDNLEHVLGGVDLLAALLERAPGVKVLATSRERLGLRAEWVCDLGGMRRPAADAREVGAEWGAVALFRQVARRHGRALGPDDLPDVIRICDLVDGMPLAIELAGGWTSVMNPAEIHAEVARGLDVLASDAHDVPARQRSIRAAIGGSWQRLSAAERDGFARLSVFRGGFSLAAARTVANADLRMLRALVRASFVRVEADGRYGVHELLRQFGAEHLDALAARDAVLDEHASHYLARLAELEPGLKGAHQRASLAAIGADWQNFVGAWRRAVVGRKAALLDGAVESLHLYADVRGRARRVGALCDAAVAALDGVPGAEPVVGRLLARGAFLRLLHLGVDLAAAEAALDRAAAIARRAGATGELAYATWASGVLAVVRDGDLDRSEVLHEEARRLFDQLGDRFYGSRVLNSLAVARFDVRPLAEYTEPLRRALAWATELGNHMEQAQYRLNLADVTLMQGAYAETEASLRASLAIAEDMDLPVLGAYTSSMLGFCLVLRGDLDEASRAAARADAILADLGYADVFPVREALTALLACFGGDADAGLRAARRSLDSPRGSMMGLSLLARWCLGLGHAARGEDAEAWRHVRGIVDDCARLGPAVGTWTLPIAALLAARAGDPTAAVERLALTRAHPLAATGWQDRWHPAVELRRSLEQELGGETFARAWARGERADLAATLADLRGAPDG